MARPLELGAPGGGRPRGQSRRGEPRQPVGEGTPPRADLGAGIAVAAAGSRAGPARRALGWAAAQAAARAGAPRTPPLRRVTFRRQRGLARRGEARAPGGALGAPGRREARVPREEAPRRKARGRGGRRAQGPRGHPSAQCRGWRRGRRCCLAFPPADSDLASPGRAGAAARGALMARFRPEERAPSRSLSGLGTCPSASRGLLSMESFASRWPQRAGSRRAQLREQARRQRRRPAASPPSPPPPASARRRQRPHPPRRAPAPATPGLSLIWGSPVGPPALVFPASLTALLTGPANPLLDPPSRCSGRDGLSLPGPGSTRAKLGKNALGQQCPKTRVLGRKGAQIDNTLKTSPLFCA